MSSRIGLPIPFALDDDHIASELLNLDNSDLNTFGAREKMLHIVNADGNYELTFEISRIRVAANPQDHFVVTMGNRILVIVNDGGVFAHDITGRIISIPFQLAGPPVAFNPQDHFVVTMGNRILVIDNDGGTFAHDLAGNTIGPAFQLS